MFDANEIKREFPILWRKVHAKPLIYLDNAASSQKPQQVIDAVSNYYAKHNANVHRGVHLLSDESTELWHQSRNKIAKFFGAEDEELIMTRNTTESMNGVAYGWADHNLKKGDVILTSILDHHSSLVVWQQAAERTGAVLEYIDLTPDGLIDFVDLEHKLKSKKVKLIGLPHVSNTLGSVVPLDEVCKLVDAHYHHEDKPRLAIDGAQAAPHLPVDFSKLGVDFYAASGHKMLGPMGSGVLLVNKEILKSGEMQPWYFGGGMISEVSAKSAEFSDNIVDRFTPGTPDVAAAVGLAAACEYLNNLGMEAVLEHDLALIAYALERLEEISEIELLGPIESTKWPVLPRLGSVSFIYKGVHAHDVAQVLDSQGVAVRSGHHCTMPLHTQNNWVASTRASFQVYNTEADIDALVEGLAKVKEVFK